MTADESSLESAGPGSWRPFAAVLGLALVLRLGLLALVLVRSPKLDATHAADTHTYLQPACSLLASRDFVRQGVPELVRTPGYPLMLTLGVALGHVELVTVLLQIALSLATVWLVHRLALLVGASRRAALVAALLLAVDPLSIAYTCYLMPETLFAFLLVLGIVSLLEYFHAGRLGDLLAAAGLVAAAALVRPVGYYLAPLFALCLLARLAMRLPDRRRRAAEAVLFAAACLAPLAAWQVRNQALTGYSGFSAVADWNLYFYQAAGVIARQTHASLESVQAELGYFSDADFRRAHPELAAGDQAAKFRFLHAAGTRILGEHALAYGVIHVRGLATLALNPAATDLLRLVGQPPPPPSGGQAAPGPLASAAAMLRGAPRAFAVNLALGVGLAAFYAGCIAGGLALLRRPSWQAALVGLAIAYLFAVSGGPACVVRLRHPIMPLACVFAGLGLVELYDRWRRWRGKTVAISRPDVLPAQQSI